MPTSPPRHPLQTQARHGQSCAHRFQAFPDRQNALTSRNARPDRLKCPPTAELGFKNACKTVANHLEEDAVRRLEQSGEQESEESQRIRELLTGEGGYVFHGTRVTGLTWAYRLSGGNLRAVQAIAGHTSPKMALRYQRAEMDYLAAVAGNVSSMIEASTRK